MQIRSASRNANTYTRIVTIQKKTAPNISYVNSFGYPVSCGILHIAMLANHLFSGLPYIAHPSVN